MITVTGDLHGDLTRFKQAPLKKLGADDTLVVCGDFGFSLEPPAPRAKPTRAQKDFQWLCKRPFTILFVSGVHDNHAYLASLPTLAWHGGKVHQLGDRVFHLCSGELFLLEEDYYLAIGGGAATEEEYVASDGQWAGEAPDPTLLPRVQQVMAARHNVADYVISHECPSAIYGCLAGEKAAPHVDHVTPALDWVMQECLYKKWFSGSLHLDKRIPPAYYAMYKTALPVRGGAK